MGQTPYFIFYPAGLFMTMHWAIPEKKQTGGGKQCGFSRDDQEKLMWNFQGSCFQGFKFMRSETQFCGVSRGEALFCLQFPVVK